MIILDEPTSALDVSVQAKIINTLLKAAEGTESDLPVHHPRPQSDAQCIQQSRHHVLRGRLLKSRRRRAFFQNPQHPYTKMLLSSIPVVTEAEEALKPTQIHSEGEIPSPVNVPKGCSFNTRCPFAMEICRQVDPQMVTYAADHTVRCHLCKPKNGGIEMQEQFCLKNEQDIEDLFKGMCVLWNGRRRGGQRREDVASGLSVNGTAHDAAGS